MPTEQNYEQRRTIKLYDYGKLKNFRTAQRKPTSQ